MMNSLVRTALLALVAACHCQAFVVPAAQRSTTALSVAIDTSDIKNGLTIELDGEPYKVRAIKIQEEE